MYNMYYTPHQKFKHRELLLLTVLVLLFQSIQSASLDTKSKGRIKLSKYPKLIVLSFDGFRYDYMTKTDTPTLDRLKTGGVHSAYMKPQFPTKTFPNHQSIVTGLHTESHGIVDNQVYDQKHGILSGYETYPEKFWNYRSDVVPVWILNEWAKPGRYSGANWPGANIPYGVNKTLPTHHLTYNKDQTFEDRLDHVMKWLTHETKPANLIFMYFDEPDGQAHAFGPDSAQVILQIQKMDIVTKYLVDRLKEKQIQDQVNIMIISDHGFQEVTMKNLIKIAPLVDNTLYHLQGRTPVYHITPKHGKGSYNESRANVYKGLVKGLEGKNATVYWKRESPTDWHYRHSDRIGSIIVVADPGYVFDDMAQGNYDVNRIFGVHGYDNNAETMRAFFLGYGPAFKKGLEIPAFDNIDLFPLMCKIISISPAPNNGTLNIVQNALSL